MPLLFSGVFICILKIRSGCLTNLLATVWINMILSIEQFNFFFVWTQSSMELLMIRVIRMFQINLHIQGMQTVWLSLEDPNWGRSVCHFYFCCHLHFSFLLEKCCIHLTLIYVLRHKRQEFNSTGLKQLWLVVLVRCVMSLT